MFPRWLSWMFVLVMGYLIYAASPGNKMVDPQKPLIPAITDAKYPALAETTDAERWKRKLDPDYAATMNCTLDTPKNASNILAFKVVEDEPGTGDGAVCGSIIRIALTVWSASGAKAYSGTLDLALGSRQIASGLDAGLVGIAPGATRTLVMPPYAQVQGTAMDAYAAAFKVLPKDGIAIVSVKRVK